MGIKKNILYILANTIAFFAFIGLGLIIASPGHDMGLGTLFGCAQLGIIIPFIISIIIIRKEYKTYLVSIIIHSALFIATIIFFSYIN